MKTIEIEGKKIGQGYPAFLVAEMSANHGFTFSHAARVVRAAKKAGADAIKVQTYTADTITIDCPKDCFTIRGTIWENCTLYDLYDEAHMPWGWQTRLQATAKAEGLSFFSTPFDPSAVDFLERLDVPAYKVASFELVDIPLIEKIAKTGKPMILSTGMSTLAEIEEAVKAARNAGAEQIALLKCTSAYPAPAESMNLRTIPDLIDRFGLPVGLSDHSLGIAAAVTAVALGASIIEKHFTLSRRRVSPDSAFSVEPKEFAALVDTVRTAEKALGKVCYERDNAERASLVFRRSLFVVKDMRAGETFTQENIRSIRPGNGLAPKHLYEILGKKALKDLPRGTPLDWNVVG